MSFLDFKNAIAAGGPMPHVAELFLRMALAAVLGALLAYRPWRRWMASTTPPSLQVAQSQTLMAAAGALMVVVIGDNMARAFGLVGLGSFIRFRSGISDPRDAAIMFVMIGIGMACGLGLPVMATAGTVFVGGILIVFDATVKRRAKRTVVTFIADDPQAAWREVSKLFPGSRALEVSSTKVELGKDSGKLVVELDLRGTMDAATILGILAEHRVPGISRVALTE